jgi:hypothetical protein
MDKIMDTLWKTFLKFTTAYPQFYPHPKANQFYTKMNFTTISTISTTVKLLIDILKKRKNILKKPIKNFQLYGGRRN